MSVIIRLQGLPWTASAMNIRHFFTGLNIPAGGVHIIGGEGGDAFIAFSSDEDARMAMKMNMSALNGVPVQLFLSSKSEMQSVIDAARSGGSGAPTNPMQSQSMQGMGQTGMTNIMPNQPQLMSGFNQGMQTQGQNMSMMNQKPNFQMQQSGNMNLQNDANTNTNMATGNFPGGMNMRNNWQGYPGMDNQGQYQNQNSQSQDMTNYQPNQSMMRGGQFDQFSGFQNDMRQQQFNSSGGYSGTSGFGPMGGNQQGQNPVSESKAPMGMNETSGLGGNMTGPNQNRFNETAQRPSPARGASTDNQEQYAGMKDTMNQGNMPGQRAGSLGKDRGLPVSGQTPSIPEGPSSGFPQDRFGRHNMPGEQSMTAPMNTNPWAKEKMADENYPDRNQYRPDMNREQMFRQDTGIGGGQRWPNQMREGLDAPNRPFGMGMGRTNADMEYMDRGRFQGGPLSGQFPKRAQGDVGGDRGSQQVPDDGLPSSRYPPDDDYPAVSDNSRNIGLEGPIDGARKLPDDRKAGPGDRNSFPENPNDQRTVPDMRGFPANRSATADDQSSKVTTSVRRRPSRFDRDEKGMLIEDEQRPPSNDSRFPPEDSRFPGNQQRFPPSERFGNNPDRSYPLANRYPSDRLPRDNEMKATGEGRPSPDDRSRSMSSERMGRSMPDDRMGRPMPDDRMGRPMPDDRMGRPVLDDRMGRPMPDDRMGRQMQDDRMGRPMSDDGMPRPMPDDPMGRPMPNDRLGRPMPDDPMTRPMPNDRLGRPMPDDPMTRPMPKDRLGRPMPDERISRLVPEDRMGLPGLDDKMAGDDRMDYWPEYRMRSEEAMGRGRRPEENAFPPDDPRYMDRDEDFYRRAFDYERRGRGERFMHGRGRGGPMRGDGRPGSDRFGNRPYPPDWRGDYPPEEAAFRGEEDYLYGPDARYPDDPYRSRRSNRMPQDTLEEDKKPGLLETPVGFEENKMERRPPQDIEGDGNVPLDMDQRFEREMDREPRRWPGRFSETDTLDYGRGVPMEGYGRGGPPRDFDSRSIGPRGRGEPFGRGRPGGMPPFGRGRGREEELPFSNQGAMEQDVDNRRAEENYPNKPDQPAIEKGRGLLGEAPPTHQDSSSNKEATKVDAAKKDEDKSSSRRNDDRDRDRRYNDDRRGRDRDDRDRYSYRSRYDRDRERDRDRRRSRSRSRERGSRDRDSRYSRDNRDRSSKDRSSKSDTDLSKNERPTRFVLIKNLPKTYNYREIRRFIDIPGIPSDGIKIINDKDGNRTGDCCVYFHRVDAAIKTQRKNGERIEGRSVSTQYIPEEEFNKVVDSFVPTKANLTPTTTPAPAATNTKQETTQQNDAKLRFIVQLKNLPLSITRQDISNFFKNQKIDKEGEAAYIEFDQNGVATGISFVEFKTDIDYKQALTQNGGMIGTNKINVTPGDPVAADKLKSVQGEMFQRAALRSIANKTGSNNIGPRPPLVPGAIQPPQPNQQQQMAPGPKLQIPLPQDNNDNVCVHIQGLPLLATPQDIREFFTDCQIAVRGIHIAHDGNGKPLGEGFVEFKNHAEVEKALKKDKTSLGRHVVAVKPISKKVMTERLENAKQRGGPMLKPKPATPVTLPSPHSSPSPQTQIQKPQQNDMPQTQAIPFPKPPPTSQDNNTKMPQTPPQQQRPSQPAQPPQPVQEKKLPPQQNQQPPQQNQQPPQPPFQHQQPNQMQQPQIPGPPQQRHPHPDMGNRGPMGGGPNSSMPLLHTPNQGPPLVMAPGGGKSFPPGVLNGNWFYVRCQNFPPDITIAEIMQFFHTCRPIGESIRLHYSSDGQATGNAVVGFFSAEEANMALQRLNMTFCRRNPINLHPA